MSTEFDPDCIHPETITDPHTTYLAPDYRVEYCTPWDGSDLTSCTIKVGDDVYTETVYLPNQRVTTLLSTESTGLFPMEWYCSNTPTGTGTILVSEAPLLLALAAGVAWLRFLKFGVRRLRGR